MGRDAYALSLGYYGDADYKGIGTAWDDDQPASIAQRPFAPMGMPGIGSTLAAQHKPLYNGNIAHTVNSLQPFGLWGPNGQGQVLAQVYTYDQLNRLKKARGVIGLDEYNTWEGVDDDAATNRYRSEYEYDANGNILSAERYDADENHYDAFSYKYERHAQRLKRNRLYQLNDLADEDDDWVNEAAGAKDIGWTGEVPFDEEDANMNTAYNYGYDALGNLVRDNREGIESIEWTVAGKVRRVEASTRPAITFGYGAAGHRIMKQVNDQITDAGAYREHYIRDARGNIMATYRFTNSSSTSLEMADRPIYGSARLGSYVRPMELYNASALLSNPAPSNIIQRAHLRYELSDHLGNVATTITGRLIASASNAPYEADLIAAQGLEPFGALLPDRSYNAEKNLRLFQGQVRDDEIYGTVGLSYAFEYRMHDARVGRFWSVDPLAAKYPFYTTYSFSGNRVIDMVELEGLEPAEIPTNRDDEVQVAQLIGQDDKRDYTWSYNHEYMMWDLIGGTGPMFEVNLDHAEHFWSPPSSLVPMPENTASNLLEAVPLPKAANYAMMGSELARGNTSLPLSGVFADLDDVSRVQLDLARSRGFSQYARAIEMVNSVESSPLGVTFVSTQTARDILVGRITSLSLETHNLYVESIPQDAISVSEAEGNVKNWMVVFPTSSLSEKSRHVSLDQRDLKRVE